MNQIKNRIKGGLYGLIVGDALGVPYEFRTKEEMKSNPCIDMIEYGTYNLPKGTWIAFHLLFCSKFVGNTESIANY